MVDDYSDPPLDKSDITKEVRKEYNAKILKTRDHGASSGGRTKARQSSGALNAQGGSQGGMFTN